MNTALDARDEEGNEKLKYTHKKSTDTPRFRQKLTLLLVLRTVQIQEIKM